MSRKDCNWKEQGTPEGDPQMTKQTEGKRATQPDEAPRAASRQHSPDQSSVSTTQNPE